MPAKCHCKVIQRCSGKKLFLKIWQFHSKTPVPESPLNKVAGQRLATSIKKILWHRFFPVNITKFLGISFFKEHLWWLPLVKLDPNLWNQQNFSSNCFRLHLISWVLLHCDKIVVKHDVHRKNICRGVHLYCNTNFKTSKIKT